MLSLFWAGMVVARLVLTRVAVQARGDRVPGIPGRGPGGSGAALGHAEHAAAGAGLSSWVSVLAAGFPILLGFLGGLYRDLTGTAFRAVFVMALIGGSASPLSDGRAGRPSGLRAPSRWCPSG